MKVLWHGFCGKQHSWSVCAQNICRILKKLGHNVHMFSTNGDQHFPEDLRESFFVPADFSVPKDLNHSAPFLII